MKELVRWLSRFNVGLEQRKWPVTDGQGAIPKDDPKTCYRNFEPPRWRWLLSLVLFVCLFVLLKHTYSDLCARHNSHIRFKFMLKCLFALNVINIRLLIFVICFIPYIRLPDCLYCIDGKMFSVSFNCGSRFEKVYAYYFTIFFNDMYIFLCAFKYLLLATSLAEQ